MCFAYILRGVAMVRYFIVSPYFFVPCRLTAYLQIAQFGEHTCTSILFLINCSLWDKCHSSFTFISIFMLHHYVINSCCIIIDNCNVGNTFMRNRLTLGTLECIIDNLMFSHTCRLCSQQPAENFAATDLEMM